jgi:two-component system cell cycle response regulator
MSQRMLRILLAEGGAGETAQSLRAAFLETESQLDLTVVSTVMTLLPTLKVTAPEILLLDLSLAQPDPLDTVRRVHRSAPGVPLIVIADPIDRDLAARCLSEGAMDYLLKGFMNHQTLEHVFRAALESNTLKGLADLLRDSLTGLYIREGFLALGARSMEVARHSRGTMVLLCAMLENLDSIRAEFGQSGGDRALRDLAELLAGSFRRTDIVARLGEAQFAALAVDAIEPSAAVLRQRLERRLDLCNKARSPWGSLEMRICASFWSVADTRSFAEFLDGVESGLRHAPAVAGRKEALGEATFRG